MAGKIFGQILNWLMTESIVNTLSNSRTFQRVVLKWDKMKTELEVVAEEKATEAAKHAAKAAAVAKETAKKQVETMAANAKLAAEAQSEALRKNAGKPAPDPGGVGTSGPSSKGIVINGFNVSTFFRHLSEEVKKDMGKGGGSASVKK